MHEYSRRVGELAKFQKLSKVVLKPMSDRRHVSAGPVPEAFGNRLELEIPEPSKNGVPKMGCAASDRVAEVRMLWNAFVKC